MDELNENVDEIKNENIEDETNVTEDVKEDDVSPSYEDIMSKLDDLASMISGKLDSISRILIDSGAVITDGQNDIDSEDYVPDSIIDEIEERDYTI